MVLGSLSPWASLIFLLPWCCHRSLLCSSRSDIADPAAPMAGPEKDKVMLVWDYDSWSNQRWEQTQKIAKQSNDFEHESNDQAKPSDWSFPCFRWHSVEDSHLGIGMFGMGRLEVPVRLSQQISCVPRIGVWSTPILPLDRNAVQNLPAWYTRGTRGLGMMWDDWEKNMPSPWNMPNWRILLVFWFMATLFFGPIQGCLPNW